MTPCHCGDQPAGLADRPAKPIGRSAVSCGGATHTTGRGGSALSATFSHSGASRAVASRLLDRPDYLLALRAFLRGAVLREGDGDVAAEGSTF